MAELRNQSLKNLLRKYEGKTILIVCINGYKYRAHNFVVYDGYISFIDKFDSETKKEGVQQ